jgi:branched-subunit amino acid transport protein AzlD
MTQNEVWIAIAIIAFVTALTRFLPFLAFGSSKKTPKFIERLGGLLPYAIMGMLVVYCLKGMSFTDGLGGFLPEIISVLLVSVLYIWRRNTLLSIIAGTVCYMLLVQLVF